MTAVPFNVDVNIDSINSTEKLLIKRCSGAFEDLLASKTCGLFLVHQSVSENMLMIKRGITESYCINLP